MRRNPNRYHVQSFKNLVLEGFSFITWEQISGFYKHCIENNLPLEQQNFLTFN